LEPSRSFGIAVEGAGAGVEVTVSVAVATVDPIRGAGAVLGPADRVASAESRVLMNVPSGLRSILGDALGALFLGHAGRRAGGQARYLDPTVIVVSFFESVSADRSK